MNDVSKEPESIANRDWRIQAITTLAKDMVSPTGVVEHKAGTAVKWSTSIAYDERELWFAVPSPPALLLSLSHRLAEEVRSSLRNLPEFTSSTHKECALYDLLEDAMGAVVFAVTALKAYANESIPEDFEWRTSRSDRRYDEVYNRVQIERFVPLDRKLGEILPAVMEVASPKGTRLWERYKELTDLRDRIVHLKQSELTPVTQPVPNNLWNMLLDSLPVEAPERVFDMIRHFGAGRERRWIAKCPVSKNETA